MIRGLGTDVVDIRRVEQLIQRGGAWLERRILSDAEQRLAANLATLRKVEFLAGRFAAKEAIAKATGQGLGHLRMREVSIEPTAGGQPIICWLYETGRERDAYVDGRWHVSISHTPTTAFAVAIWEDTEN